MARKNNTQRRVLIIVGWTLAIIMALSLILPLVANNVGFANQSATSQETTQPTPFPTSLPQIDLEQLTYDETFTHPSGVYTVNVPSNFQAFGNSAVNEARTVMNDFNTQSVVDVRVIPSELDLSDSEVLNEVFNEEWLANSWSNYTWEETSRNLTDDRLTIDFNLTRNDQAYIARQAAWTDGEWIYTTRVVAPSNSALAVQEILNNVADSVVANPQYYGADLSWSSYIDDTDNQVIRFPRTWRITDAADGGIISATDGESTLRMETDATVVDEESAREWMESWRSGIEVLSVEPVDRGDASGFAVSYSLTSADGDLEIGKAILLNGANDTLHIANIRTNSNEVVDLNDSEAASTFSDLSTILSSFIVLPESEEAETTE